MTILLANFKADLISCARQHLTEQWGPEAAQFADEEALIVLFDSIRRHPPLRPRRIWLADDFCCPKDTAEGWNALRAKITNGAELGPYLSRCHKSPTNLDGLLNEWGVHHFHLGTKFDPRYPYYVERTRQLLFAYVRDEDFYAINIYHHGDWEELTIIESLHRNWPQILSRYRVNGVCGEILTVEQRRRLRQANCETFTTVSDDTVYLPVGVGVCSSGVGVEAVTRACALLGDVKRLQNAMEERVATLIPRLRERGYKGQSKIRAKLLGITPQGYQVLFPDYQLLANVKLQDDSFA